MIKAVIFDCFGVLVEEAWRPFSRQHFTTPEEIKWSDQLMQRVSSGKVSHRELASIVEDKTGFEAEDFMEILHTNPPNEQLLDYLPSLKDSGLKIGMLSNVGHDFIEDLLSPEQVELFDDLTLSYQVNLTKPDPDIYRRSASRLGVEPSECVFIDDVKSYCQGAESVGMKAVHYQDFDSFKRQLTQILT